MKWRSLRSVLIALVILGVSCGCWDNKDINKRYLPVVIGIGEGENDKYKVILQVPRSKGNTQIFEREARSVSKAIDKSRTDAEKSIDLVHLRLFLISEGLARKGIKDIVNFAVRSNDISIKGMVAIIKGDFSKALYHQISPVPEVSSYDFFSEEAGWTPNVSIKRIWECYRSINSYSEDMVVPLLEVGTDTLYTFKGSAIIRGERMVGTLTPEETLLYNIFKNKYTGGMIEVAQDASVNVTYAKAHHHPKWSKSSPELNSTIDLDIVEEESTSGQSDEQIKRKVEKTMNGTYMSMINKFQKLNTDAFVTGLLFRSQLSQKEIQDWRSQSFPHLKQTITVHANVLNDIYFKEKSGNPR